MIKSKISVLIKLNIDFKEVTNDVPKFDKSSNSNFVNSSNIDSIFLKFFVLKFDKLIDSKEEHSLRYIPDIVKFKYKYI